MSNLSDFVGLGDMLGFYRHDGLSSSSLHGAYDFAESIRIAGTTADIHSLAREFKFHRVPGKRIFGSWSNNYNRYFWIKVNTGANMALAPDPSGNWYDQDNSLPVINNVVDTLRFKFSTKNSASDSYSVVETYDFSSGIDVEWGNHLGNVNNSKHASSSNLHLSFHLDGGYTTSGSQWWQGSNTNANQFLRLEVRAHMNTNIDECIFVTDSDGELWTKLEWTVDNTSWNNLFSGSDWTADLVEGILMGYVDGTMATYLYAGQREYGMYSTRNTG